MLPEIHICDMRQQTNGLGRSILNREKVERRARRPRFYGTPPAALVINGHVMPRFKGGLRHVDAMRAEANPQERQALAAVRFQFNPLAGL